ncbi:hypothetical protein [Acidobacterium sp. S8]|uniref:hypothetical protein n=1 Tax=Acidobacterium sp. S8 TaxID=1641854 RepID=UPI00131DA5BE|nr:hypothetical protein [Acidobacterium sp. S8]
MSNPTDRLNEEQTESSFGQPENEHEFEPRAGVANFSIHGGKGPGLAEDESE